MSSVSSDDMESTHYVVPDLYEVTPDMIVAPGVYQTHADKYHTLCKCLDFHDELSLGWMSKECRPAYYFLYENIHQGEFPDWLKIHDPDADVLDAMCRARPKDYVYRRPEDVLCPFAEGDDTVDEEFWMQADGSIEPVDKLPFESLITMMNTFQFPASHTGMESVLFWMKIYARYWTSYGFCLLRIEEKKELDLFRREILDPNQMWMLPYWCLRNVGQDRLCRHMILVVRNTQKFVKKWEVLHMNIIGNAFEYLEAIAQVSVSNEKIHHIAQPMIPHALKWMCILMPDCYEEYINTYEDEFYTLCGRGISCCRLTIGGFDERINLYRCVPKKEMAETLTGKPFVFSERNKCYFLEKIPEETLIFEYMLFPVSKQQQIMLDCVQRHIEPLEAKIQAMKHEQRDMLNRILPLELEIAHLKSIRDELEKENRRLKLLKTPTQTGVRRSLRRR